MDMIKESISDKAAGEDVEKRDLLTLLLGYKLFVAMENSMKVP